MRSAALVITVVALALASVVSAMAGPRPAELGRIAADGPLSLSSSQPGSALLSADHILPGESVSGLLTLSNTGEQPGDLSLAVGDLQDRPGANGGSLSQVLRLKVESVDGDSAPVEATLSQASQLTLGSIPASSSRTYRVTATFPDGGVPAGPLAGDNLQKGSGVSVGLDWRLEEPDPAVPTPGVNVPAPPVASPPVTSPPATAPRPDPRALLLKLRIPAQRVIGPKGLKAYATCEVACKVRFSAAIDSAPKGKRKRKTLMKSKVLSKAKGWKALRAGREQKVMLKLTAKARKRLKLQLRKKGRAGITITATMQSAAGNRTVSRRIVMRTYKKGEQRRASKIPAG